MLTIQARAAGQRRDLIPQWQTPLPPDGADRGRPLTLRDLIERIVRAEVSAFRERQVARSLVRVMTATEIGERLVTGRVTPGPPDVANPNEVADEQAVSTALQGFEDGLYLVFIDGLEHRDLDEQVFPAPDSTITFVRLVMLAGA